MVSTEIVVQRMQATRIARSFKGTFFPLRDFCDVATPEVKHTSLFKRTTIVVLLSTSGCNPCQVRELQNLNSISNEVSDSVSFVGIFNSNNRNEALALRKVGMPHLPMWFGEDSIVARYNITNKYPVIFVVRDQIVFFTFVPIPMDDEFSVIQIRNLLDILRSPTYQDEL